jgi:hypothetical protein
MGDENCNNEHTDMERITAQQLAIFGGRGVPNESDKYQALELVDKWNKERIQLGLQVWA